MPPSDSAKPLQEAIDACRARNGGTIVLAAGTHRLDRSLRFHNAVNIALVGEGSACLEMARQVVMTAAEAAPKGQHFIVLEGDPGGVDLSTLEVQAPGRVDTTPTTGKPRQIHYFNSEGERIEGSRLILRAPLAYSVPRGSRIIPSYNAIHITGSSRNLSFHGLVIDGNRAGWPVRPLNHSTHCGIFAAAPYSSDKGPSADPIKGLVLSGLSLRGFHHRGVAFYNVTDSVLANCTIEDTGGEAIDLDHFVVRCQVVDCRLRRAPRGVELNDASNCAVISTLIEDCAVGIRLWRWCTLDGLNTGNAFIGNTIRRAAKEGIGLAVGTAGSRVINNTMEDCAIGIRVAGDDSVVQGNAVRRCKKSVVITGKNNRVMGIREE